MEGNFSMQHMPRNLQLFLTSLLWRSVPLGGSLLEGLGRVVAPLYFQVIPMKIVPATNEQCDLAFSYEDGHFELKNAVPNGYPQPG